MRETYIIICLKQKKQRLKEYQINYRIINKTNKTQSYLLAS